MTAVAAALLTLSACGGDDSGDVSIASTPTTEADASSPTDADADAEPPKADDADDNGDLDVEMFYGEAGMYDGERLWSGAISMPFDALRDEPGEGFYIRRIEGAKVYAEGASSLLVDDGMMFLAPPDRGSATLGRSILAPLRSARRPSSAVEVASDGTAKRRQFELRLSVAPESRTPP